MCMGFVLVLVLWFLGVGCGPIRSASANSMESDLRHTPRVYFDNVMLMSHKPCQHNNKLKCSEKSNKHRRMENEFRKDH